MGKWKRSVLRGWLVVFTAGLLLGGCAGPDKTTAGGPELERIAKRYPELNMAKVENGVVKRIVDGDTFELAGGDKVRLIGVNTPETHGQVQYFGKEASSFTTRELQGQQVFLFPDVSGQDRYGRLLRYVFLAGEDVMFNERLLTEGYAQVMTVPPNVTFARHFLGREREARSQGTGLWAAERGNDGKETNAPKDSSAGSPPPCPNPVKGNINSKGDKIYHVPGGASYENTKPEQWFCSEQEAVEAGFRKAGR